jgi:hypothetical protein
MLSSWLWVNRFLFVVIFGAVMTAASSAAVAAAASPKATKRIEKPDVTVGLLSVLPASVHPGDQLLVRYNPKSVGLLDGGYYMDFHLTSRPDQFSDQTRISRKAISVATSRNPPAFPLAFEYNVPVTQGAGDYYIVAVADSTNCINELVESNNTMSRPLTIERVNTTATAAAPRPRTSLKLANLRMERSAVHDGDRVAVGCDIINDGQTRVTQTTCKVVLYDDEVAMVNGQEVVQPRAHAMASVPVRNIAPGTTSSAATSMLIPWNIATPTGGNTVEIVLDPDGLLNEPRAGNVLSGKLNITVDERPDLQPRVNTTSAFSGRMNSSVVFSMSLSVVNTGNRASLPSTCSVRFLREDRPGHWENVGWREHQIPALAARQAHTAEHSYDARTWGSGNIKMVVTADADHDMAEFSERNNVDARRFVKP